MLGLSPSNVSAEEMCSQIDLVSPARYEDKQITLVYEAYEMLRVIPAVYKDEIGDIVDTPSHCPGTTFRLHRQRVYADREDRLQIIPPTFKVVKNEDGVRYYVLNKPARIGRVPNNGYPRRMAMKVVDHPTKCEPEERIPAQIRKITRRVVDKPASTRREWVPEQSKTITERVIVEPAIVTIHEVPCGDD